MKNFFANMAFWYCYSYKGWKAIVYLLIYTVLANSVPCWII